MVVEPLNKSIPLLMSDEYLANNLSEYNQAIEAIILGISNDEEKICTDDDLIQRLTHNINLILDEYFEDNLHDNPVFLSFNDLYSIKCDYHIDTYLKPLDYRLISFRNYLSKTDNYCVKIIYSLYHWEKCNDTFNIVVRELGLRENPRKIDPISSVYKNRCIKFLKNHISKNEKFQEIINLAYNVFVLNPYYENLMSKDYFDEYNIGYSFEGFEDFSLFDDNVDNIINDFIKLNDESCFAMIENSITFDIRYMIESLDFSCNYDYFFDIVYLYTNFIYEWNSFTKEIIDSIQLKLDFND